MTEANLKLEEFNFLTCAENLQKWAHIPLLGRCVLFHRQFPERWVSRWTLSKIMRKAGIKKKTVVIRNLPQRRTMRIEEFENKTLALQA